MSDRIGDRAQAEVLGFVLVFGLIVAAIALVTTTGYAGLTQSQDTQRTTNAVQSLQVLADNGEAVRRGAPARSTEIELADARLFFGDPVTVRVHGEASGSDANFTHVVELTPLVFDTGSGTQFVYVNGAVVRDDRGEAVIVADPASLLADSEAVLTLPVLVPESSRSVGGSSTVDVKMRRTDGTLLATLDESTDLTVEIESPHAGVWKEYYDGLSGVSCTRPAPDTARCSVTTDRVTVSVVEIETTIQ